MPERELVEREAQLGQAALKLAGAEARAARTTSVAVKLAGDVKRTALVAPMTDDQRKELTALADDILAIAERGPDA
jgi:hypothetical protein